MSVGGGLSMGPCICTASKFRKKKEKNSENLERNGILSELFVFIWVGRLGKIG